MNSYNVAEVEQWIADDPDPKTALLVADLLALAQSGDAESTEELEDCFQGLLKFGTAGLRGHMGGGPNRMNRAVVLRAAAGLMAFLHEALPKGFTIVIGYDARHGSRQFALDTAAVAESAGGHALLFSEALPTPLTAFALRHFNADAAVVVTASHNPAQDNGYKVYLGGRIVTDAGQGSQIVSPADAEIFTKILQISSVSSIPLAESGWEWLGADVVEAYLQRVSQLVTPGPRDLRIVLTSMHGVGGKTMVESLRRNGFTDIHVVSEQQEPNPDFPTVKFPNPEEPGALDLAMALARQVSADIILANDPDADRCSAALPDPSAESGWRQLTGDQVGAILGVQAAHENAGMGTRTVLANSLVSSRLLGQIAAKHGVKHTQTLTGFKWISRVPKLVFGYEEALGYCVDPQFVRDKDGISACTKLAAIAAAEKSVGRSLQSILDDQAREFGVYATAPLTIRVDDLSLIARGMANLRAKGIKMIAGSPVIVATDLAVGSADLPPTDGLLYLTQAQDQIIVRPSGTEPKLKCYIEVIQPVPGNDLLAARSAAETRLETIKTDMLAAIGIPRPQGPAK